MMGRTHAVSGWAAATLTLPLLNVTDPRIVLALSMAAAGATLLPDLDSTTSTMARSLGPVTHYLSRLVRWSSRRAWAWTATDYDRADPRRDVGHRHLSHTLPACLLAGVMAWVVTVGAGFGLGKILVGVEAQVVSSVAAGLVCGALAVPAARYVLAALPGVGEALARQASPAVGGVVALVGAWGQVSAVTVGVVVAVGAVVGVLGDWLTPHGVPVTWPVVVRGKRWWMHQCRWTFRTGEDSPQEKFIRWACVGLGITSWVTLVPSW